MRPAFNVSSDDLGGYPDDLSVSVIEVRVWLLRKGKDRVNRKWKYTVLKPP